MSASLAPPPSLGPPLSPLLAPPPPPSALAGTLEQLELFVAAQAGRDPSLHARLARALDAVAKCLHVFRGAREVAFSFNGGKDSTVVLHLLRLVLLRRRGEVEAAAEAAEAAEEGARAVDDAAASVSAGTAPAGSADAEPRAPAATSSTPSSSTHPGLGGVRLVYFETRDNFPEVLAFMAETAAALGVECETLRGGFKAGLRRLLDEGARCVLMGTRRADPDGGLLEVFSPTSLDWPPLMRVCPALHLGYADVWALLRGARLPFCALYAEGFTSLGALHDSARNPALALLLLKDGAGAGDGHGIRSSYATFGAGEVIDAAMEAQARGLLYLPAWLLHDDVLERAGRQNVR